MKTFIILICSSILLFSSSDSQDSIRKKLEVNFSGDAKIEVGSHYAGLAFHHSSPLPQRISFYFPVANSIDLSTDYWKRDSTFIMALALETDGKKEWLGHDKYSFTSTPYSVSFFKKDENKSVRISYDFCKDKPAFVLTMEITNLSGKTKRYALLSDIEASLRTSHTYSIKDKAWTEYDQNRKALFVNYDDKETQNARLFFINAGEGPAAYSSISKIKNLPLEDQKWWKDADWNLNNNLLPISNQGIPSASFRYEKELKPNETLSVIQIIGSAKEEIKYSLADYLISNYKNEIDKFEKYVLQYATEKNKYTGDPVLDKSILWAKALLAVNQHYIDSTIQPMPCPAEYNFYFTHDVLLTDLARMNFDLYQVKKDLEFIMSHADENYVIPHAYYWKDSTFKTELVTTDGWNHFWFIIVATKYFSTSSDKEFGQKLYPYIKKSLEETMHGEKDGIMYAYRPDWWDIGSNFGPRSYMTILAIKSMRDFLEMSKTLNIDSPEVQKYTELEKKMSKELVNKLWSDERNYLVNYFQDGSEDQHYYMGSLLAVYFDLLDKEKSEKLLETAKKYLVDEKIGVYTVYPMDFDKLIKFFKFAGNEAGDPHKYANGGIWPHCNALYILALNKAGHKKEAMEFLKRTMTIDGIINSPNGQPAMYEYRNSNKNDPSVYGEIDKPQFMWAAGFYLYCLNELLN